MVIFASVLVACWQNVLFSFVSSKVTFVDVQKNKMFFDKLCSKQWQNFKDFQHEIEIITVDYSDIILTSRVHKNILNRQKISCVILGINIFVRPDIDYVVVFTLWLLYRKRTKRTVASEDKINLKLKWIKNQEMGKFAEEIIGCGLTTVFSLLCNWF